MTENLALLDELFADFTSVPFDDEAARKYGEIRSNLARKGTPIGPNDLMIAAIALAHESVLITHNTREFKRVTGLRLRIGNEVNKNSWGVAPSTPLRRIYPPQADCSLEEFKDPIEEIYGICREY